MRQREGPKTRGKPVKLPLCLIVSFVSLKIDTIGAFLLLGLRNCVHLYVSLLTSETETVRQDGPRAVIWPKYATFAVSQARPAVRRNETSGIVPTTIEPEGLLRGAGPHAADALGLWRVGRSLGTSRRFGRAAHRQVAERFRRARRRTWARGGDGPYARPLPPLPLSCPALRAPAATFAARLPTGPPGAA